MRIQIGVAAEDARHRVVQAAIADFQRRALRNGYLRAVVDIESLPWPIVVEATPGVIHVRYYTNGNNDLPAIYQQVEWLGESR